MQVSVEITQDLERKLTVEVPVETVNGALDAGFRNIARSAKVPGFRPGKVPMNIIKQRYAAEVRQRATSDLVQSTLQRALSEQTLNPVSYPTVEAISMDDNTGLSYVAVFEVFPEIPEIDVSALEIERTRTDIQDSDIDAMIEALRKQRATWHGVERVAEMGDRVTIDFQGRVDGEAFEAGDAENMSLILGSGQMIPGFEDQIEGLCAGGEKTISVTFPEDYGQQALQHKRAEFDITVHRVEEPVLPPVDAEFAQALGVHDGDLAQLRENLVQYMQRELEQTQKRDIKDHIVERLIATYPMAVPNALVEQEIERLKEQASEQFTHLPEEFLRGQAEYRIRRAFLIRGVIRQNDIKADQDKIREMIESVADSYESPEAIQDYFHANAQARAQIEAAVVEDQVVDWVVEHARISHVDKPFAEVMQRNH